MTGRLEHQVLPFDDSEDLVGAIAAVAGRALGRGEPVLAAFPDDVMGPVQERVEGIEVLPYDGCYDAGPHALARFVDTVQRHVADGLRPTLMGGSMLVPREDPDVLGWLQMESVLNAALADTDAHLVCCFPRQGLAPWVSDAVMSTHPSMLVGGSAVPSTGYLDPQAFLAAYPEPPGPELGPPDAALSFDDAGMRTARRLVTEHATRAGLAAARIEDLTVAVNEAVTNSVEHGPGSGTLRVWAGAAGVTCEVHDAGQLEEPYLGLRPPSATSPRGRGLWLIRQLPDRTALWTDASGTTIRMTVRA